MFEHHFNLKLTWMLLVLTRFMLVLVPQLGYLHPDEFFQSTEIVAGDIFGFSVHSSWEFNTISPIRSVISTHPVPGLAYLFLRTVRDVNVGFVVTSYLLLVMPRLLMTFASLIHDWCLYRLCINSRKDPYINLIVFGSSYVCFVFYTRTFSNGIESIFFSILLCTVGCDLSVPPVPKNNQENVGVVDKVKSLDCSKIIGIIVTCGFFVRPTFVLFALCPLLFWFISKIPSRNQIWKCLQLLNNLALSSLPTAFILIVLDTLYYRGMGSFDDILNCDIPKFVGNAIVTPLNFLRYNMQASNLREHGAHPRYLHLVVNLQLLYGLLGLAGFFFCLRIMWKCVVKRQRETYDYLTVTVTASWIVPVLMLSIFPHQEPRFLIPILLPLVFLHAEFIFKYKTLFANWLVMNIILGTFFGFVHQGGLVPCLMYLSRNIVHAKPIDAHGRINVVFYHTYMPPIHLLRIEKDERTIIHDLKGQELYALKITLNNLTPSNSRNVFLVVPGSMEQSIKLATEGKFELEMVRLFSPHFTSEDFPKNISALCKMDILKNQFSLHLYHVHLRHARPKT